MKVKKAGNGKVTLTAESKRDSLNLLKFMAFASGNDNPETKALIEKKEKELEGEPYDIRDFITD